MKIALIDVENKNKRTAMNKDLNGGFGTCDEYGESISSKIIKLIKRKSIKLPIVSFAFLQAILKEKRHEVKYFEGDPSEEDWDIILIYGTIVDYKNEKETCQRLKKKFPKAKVGIWGPFPSTMPELFKEAGDFILIGEAEAYFMEEFENKEELQGEIRIKQITDMEKLPSPDYEGFPIEKYSYKPAITKKPFLVLQASKGCPYSCRFYCVYGNYQGAKIRQRSAKRVVDDIELLQKRHGVKGIQFRDPVFGLHKNFINEFCEEIERRNINIEWGMETRLDLLTEEIIKKMFKAGLRNINVGIETVDKEIAKINKRALVNELHQEKIIRFCNENGVNISAFYILGYEGDTEETMEKTVQYAIKLNTPLARFAIATPYPGTGYYEQMEKEGKLLTKEFEKYNQFTMVYENKNITPEQVKRKLEESLRRYYFRPSYFYNLIKIKTKQII